MSMEYLRLSDCAYFSTQRTKNISIENYISTENMLPNKGGITIASSLPETASASKYEVNDILLSNIRPYFKKIWLANKQGSCSNDVLVLKSKENYSPLFLYYVLSDNNYFNYATVTAKGTKMPRGTPKAILKYFVPNVSLAKQQKIASILSAYDNLIENNNKRIKILEKMAENLYKEWFVRFRFPNYQNTEFENGIPKGWKIKRIVDYGKIETGKTPSTMFESYYGADIMFVKTPDMTGNIFTCQTSEYLSVEGHSQQPTKLLPANSIMVSCIGSAGVVSINSEPAHTNQQINSIILHDTLHLEWLYFTCKSLKNTIEMFGATGATMTNLSKGKFEKLKVVDPPSQIIELYHDKTSSIFIKIKSLLYINQNLIKQRDMLLPRLMSGKLEVK